MGGKKDNKDGFNFFSTRLEKFFNGFKNALSYYRVIKGKCQ